MQMCIYVLYDVIHHTLILFCFYKMYFFLLNM